MCTSISPPYHAGAGGDFSRTGGYPNLRISSQIALFRSPLIPGRQLTAVGLKIPALRVALYDLPVDPLIRLMKATQIRPETEPTWRPGAEPQPNRPGTFAMGLWAVGTVVGSVTCGHRGRQGGPTIPLQELAGEMGC